MNRSAFTGARGEAELIVLHPADEHLAQVQSRMNPQINRTVHVFAPESERTPTSHGSTPSTTAPTRPPRGTKWSATRGFPRADAPGEKPATSRCFRDAPQRRRVIRPPASVQAERVLSTAPLASGTPGSAGWNALGLARTKKDLVLYRRCPNDARSQPCCNRPSPATPTSSASSFAVRPEAPAIVSGKRPAAFHRLRRVREVPRPYVGITGPPASDKTANAKVKAGIIPLSKPPRPITTTGATPPTAGLGLQNAFLLAAAPHRPDPTGRLRPGADQIQPPDPVHLGPAIPRRSSRTREYLPRQRISAHPSARITGYRSGDTLRLPGNGRLRYTFSTGCTRA